MKRRISWIAVLLIGALIILTGCSSRQTLSQKINQPAAVSEPGPVDKGSEQEPTESTESPEPEPTPEPEPEPPAAETWKALEEAFSGPDSYVQELSFQSTRITGGETFTDDDSYTLQVMGLGTDHPLLRLEGERTIGRAQQSYTEFWQEGVLYQDAEGAKYSSELSAEDYLSTLFPLLLLHGENYEEITHEGDTYFFSHPLSPEAWAAPGYAVLISAEGEATVENDSIAETRYRAEYLQSGSRFTIDVACRWHEAEADLSEFVPSEPESYLRLSDIRIPALWENAMAWWNTDSYQLRMTSHITSAAAGAMILETDEVSVFSPGQRMLWENNRTVYQQGTTTYHASTQFRDGTLTHENSDGDVKTEHLSWGQMLGRYLSWPEEYFPFLEEAESLTLEDAEDMLLIHFTGNEDMGLWAEDLAEWMLYSQEDLLDDLAAQYETSAMEGHLSIDKDTLLPRALYFEFTGVHEIDRRIYPLILRQEICFRPADPDADEAITEELPPDPEPETPATPVFYKVTSAEGHVMWMLGTIHVGDGRTAWLPEEIYEAFDAADALAVECDVDTFTELLDEDEELVAAYLDAYMYQDGTTVRDHVEDEELLEEMEKALKKYGSYLYLDLMPYKTTMWESEISNAYRWLGRSLSGSRGVDSRLMKRARQQEKEILEVESVQFQMQMLGNFSDLIQELELEGTLSSGRYGYNTSVEKLYEMWCRGDEEELRDYLNKEEELDTSELTEEELARYEEELEAYRDYNNQMLIQRNDAMLDVAKGYLEGDKTVFFAVGLAHLLGENGLVDALRDAGYTVELVPYAG